MQTDVIYNMDALEALRCLPEESVHCCVTSPPYYALRDYGVAGQIGRESTPKEYVARLTEVFAEVRRVLRSDGTLWLNISDTFAGKGDQGDALDPKYPNGRTGQTVALNRTVEGCKSKDIVNYAKTHDIYLQYRKLPAAKKAAFASAHEDELMLHRAAKQAFEEYGEKKLPAIKDLQAEYKELLEKKRVAYAEYRPLKQQAQELETIKKNVDSLLQIDAAQQAREAEKSRSEQSQSR